MISQIQETLFIHLILNWLYIDAIGCITSSIFGHIREKYNTRFVAIKILFCVCLTTFFWFNGPGIFNFFINLIFMLGMTLCFTIGNIKHKILLSVIITVSISALKLGFLSILKLVGIWDADTENHAFFYIVIVSKVAFFVFVKLTSPLISRISQKCISKIPISYWISLLFIPAANMYIIHLFYEQMISYAEMEQPACIAIVITLAVTLLVFLIYDHILVISEAHARVKIQDNEMEYYLTTYKNMQEASKHVLEEKHNLKNTAIGLLACLEPGDSYAIEQTRARLEELVNTCKNLTLSAWCQNSTINAILNTKTSYACEQGIEIEAHVQIENFPIPNQWISIVLGAAIDNAIEACADVFEQRRLIHVQILERNKNLFIQVRNPFVGERHCSGDLPLSTKAHPDRHGFGLRSVERLVKELNGILTIDVHEQSFKLSIILYGHLD